MSENAIEQTWLAPITTVANMVSTYNQMADFVREVLRENVDFGVVPGTDKPTLLKPGAEKLNRFFGLRPSFDEVDRIEDWSGKEHDGEPFFYYRYRCNLWRGELKMADAEGSANSWEKKHRYRQAERVCPSCGKPAIKRSKYPPRGNSEAEPGWYCYAKIGGCGSEYPVSDQRITSQQLGSVRNPDICDAVNTLQKMAQKRAFVAATLIACNGSEYFTQDVEDLSFGSSPVGEVVEGEIVKDQPKSKLAVSTNPLRQAAEAANGKETDSKPLTPKQAEKEYWNIVYGQLKWDKKAADEVIERYEGDFIKALEVAKKQLPPA